MDSASSDGKALPRSVKIVVAGAFGVGKTTFVGSVSEIAPLNTDVTMTVASQGTDPDIDGKHTTTVAMDYGRLWLHNNLLLCLFGTPGQNRFWFLWNDLVRGALAAVVLVDSTRIEEAFAAIDYFEERGDVPFVVAVNMFGGSLAHDVDEIRDALALGPDVPLVACDARDRASVIATLITAVQHGHELARSAALLQR